MLNPNLNIRTLADLFKVDKRLKIENFIQADIAEQLRNICLSNVPYYTQYVLDGKYQSKTPKELKDLSREQSITINNKIMLAASQGIGFLYDGYLKSRILGEQNEKINDGLRFAHKIFDYIGSAEVLSLIKKITGDPNITGVEPQFTRFTRGHFLTRHLDIVPGRGRRYAFVLGLTKGWHPDWGGLLQFYEKDGTPRDAWMPQFNVLSIFEVSHIHAVTFVTPFATEPRLSLTGWFTAKE